MLPDRQRLRRPADISAVFGDGTVALTPTAVVRGLPRTGAGGRAAVVAGRRIGGAVHRNRAKRRLRAALAATPPPNGHDLVLIARPDVLTASFAAVARDVRRGIERATGTKGPVPDSAGEGG